MDHELQTDEITQLGEVRGTSVSGSPVDDHTYNVLQALTSSLEALEAYEVYQEDDEGSLFAELSQDERRRAERLLGELRTILLG